MKDASKNNRPEVFAVCCRLAIVGLVVFLGILVWPTPSPALSAWDRSRSELATVAFAAGVFFFAARHSDSRAPFFIAGAIYGCVLYWSYAGEIFRIFPAFYYQFDAIEESIRCITYVFGTAFGTRFLATARGWLDRKFEKKNEGLCDGCGYVLYGLTGSRCPECGATILKSQTLIRPLDKESE